MEIEFLNSSVNLIGVLVSGVLAMVVGAIYYSPMVMANPWMKMVGLTKKDAANSSPVRTFGIAFVTLLVSFVFIGVLVSYVSGLNGYSDLVSGIVAGLMAWVFAAMTYLMNTLYAMRPLKLWVLDMIYVLICFLIAGVVLALL